MSTQIAINFLLLSMIINFILLRNTCASKCKLYIKFNGDANNEHTFPSPAFSSKFAQK